MKRTDYMAAAAMAIVLTASVNAALQPGLWYGRQAAPGTAGLNLGWYPPAVSAVAGVMAAETKASPPWGGGGTALIVYTGEVYLASSTYWFGESVDGSLYLNINGTQILHDTRWHTPTYGRMVIEEDGWYAFECRIYDDGGGYGPVAREYWQRTDLGFGYKIGDYEDDETSVSNKLGAFYAALPHDPLGSSPVCFRYNDSLGNPDDLLITGSPAELGSVDPPYGRVSGLSPETPPLECTAPAAVETEDVRATCAGYTVKDAYGTNRWDYLSGTSNHFFYTHGDGCRELTWLWNTQFRITILAEGGGSVSTNGGWFDPGATVEVTAIDGDAFFLCWLGGVDESQRTSRAITITADQAKTLTAQFGNELYVSTTGSDSHGGTSWADAKKTLAGAVSIANSNCLINVSNGTYTVTSQITVDKAITIRGVGRRPLDVVVKFTPTGGKRIFELNHPMARIENLTSSGGNVANTNGGNILFSSGGGTVSNCVICNCQVDWFGYGAVYLGSPAARLSGCVVSNNVANNVNSKDGFAVTLAAGRVENCLITGNYDNEDQSPRVRDGAVYLTGGEMVNCTIVNNEARYVAGVQCTGGAVVNCVIYGNRSTVAGGLSAVYGGGHPECFTNCASDVAAINETCVTGVFNFADPEHGDWRPQCGSICIDGGTADVVDLAPLDLDGAPRLSAGGVDIGAYEFQLGEGAIAASLASSERLALVGEEVTFSAYARPSGDYTYEWDFGDGAGSASGSTVAKSFAATGPYTVSLVVKSGGTEVARVVRQNYQAVSDGILRVVDGNAGACPPYASWATAAPDIRTAVEYAREGFKILLAEGTHKMTKPTLTVSKGVTIEGAGAVPGDARISRNNTVSSLIRLNHANAVLNNLTIQGGDNSVGGYAYGGGVAIVTHGGMVTNCIIRSNKITTYGGIGAGVYVDGPGIVTHCVITNNNCHDNADGSGGAVGAVHASGRVDNCLIAFNTTDLSSTHITKKVSGSAYITKGTIINCTIVSNRSSMVGGLRSLGGTVQNCIVSGNTSSHATTTVTNNVYYGSAAPFFRCLSDDLLINDACILDDPGFIDATFRIGSKSPAVDQGLLPAWGAEPTDLGLGPRVIHKKIDIGCYEAAWIPPGTVLILQ